MLQVHDCVDFMCDVLLCILGEQPVNRGQNQAEQVRMSFF